MKKFQFVKSKLKDWNKVSFRNLKEKRKIFFWAIVGLVENEQDGNFSPELATRRSLRKGDLEEVLLKQEVFKRQNTRIKWITKGDCNSKFFHRVANGRRNRSFFKSLVSKGGVTLDNIESI